MAIVRALKMFDASCFALLVEEILEMARGGCGGKVTASVRGVDADVTIGSPNQLADLTLQLLGFVQLTVRWRSLVPYGLVVTRSNDRAQYG